MFWLWGLAEWIIDDTCLIFFVSSSRYDLFTLPISTAAASPRSPAVVWWQQRLQRLSLRRTEFSVSPLLPPIGTKHHNSGGPEGFLWMQDAKPQQCNGEKKFSQCNLKGRPQDSFVYGLHTWDWCWIKLFVHWNMHFSILKCSKSL